MPDSSVRTRLVPVLLALFAPAVVVPPASGASGDGTETVPATDVPAHAVAADPPPAAVNDPVAPAAEVQDPANYPAPPNGSQYPTGPYDSPAPPKVVPTRPDESGNLGATNVVRTPAGGARPPGVPTVAGGGGGGSAGPGGPAGSAARRVAGASGSAPVTLGDPASLLGATVGSSPAWRILLGLALVLGIPLATLLFVRAHPEWFSRPA